jgi:inosose dehydratase
MSAEKSMRLGYNTNGWAPTPNLDAMLETIAGAGWEGVEFISIALDWLGTPTRLRVRLDRFGLSPACVFGRLPRLGEGVDVVIEGQRRLMEYSAELGCDVYCFTGADRTPQSTSSDDELKVLAEKSEELIDYAAPLGLAVAYHAHPGCTVDSESEQDRLLGYTERLRVCIDVSIAAWMREDPVAQILKYRDRLAYVHLKDVAAGKFCVMGRGLGLIDFRKVRETLDAIEYRGWVIGELGGSADTPADEGCRANREFLTSVGF